MRTFHILLLFTISMLLLLSCGTDANEEDPDSDLMEFELDSNGITITCADEMPGTGELWMEKYMRLWTMICYDSEEMKGLT